MNDEGFTYIEVLAAIFIMSLSGFLVWSGMNMGIQAVDKIRQGVHTADEISSLEFEFRNAVNSLETDYWDIKRDEETLKVFQEEDNMVFSHGDYFVYYRTLHFISLEYSDNRAVLIIQTESGKEIKIVAHWGSYYFGVES